MFRILLLLPFLTACLTTVDLPLQSQHILRPRADTGSKIYLNVGQLETPDMTNTLKEVKDDYGNVQNPHEEGVLFGSNMESESQFDFGVEVPAQVAVGVSSARGLYVIYDYYVQGPLALSATASYKYRSESKTTNLLRADGLGSEAKELKGRQSASGFAQMVSYKIPISPASSFIPYVSFGANRSHNVLKVNSNKVEDTGVLPSVVAGMFLKLRWFQISIEEGLVFSYKERHENTKTLFSHARALGANFSF